jgi:hypothetical protein
LTLFLAEKSIYTDFILLAIRAISHQFAQRQTATRWLEWLHRKQANVQAAIWPLIAGIQTREQVSDLIQSLEELQCV